MRASSSAAPAAIQNWNHEEHEEHEGLCTSFVFFVSFVVESFPGFAGGAL